MIRTLTRWLPLPSNRRGHSSKNSKTRLHLDRLEARDVPANLYVVPQGSPTDSSHFATLSAAVGAANNGDVITVEAGAQADASAVDITQSNLTIEGDKSQSAYFQPLESLTIDASNVTLSDLNLGTVTIDSGHGYLSIKNTTVNSIIENTGGGMQVGGNAIEYDRILGSVNLTGGSGSAADLIEWNIFTGTGANGGLGAANAMLSLTDDSGAQVLDNEFGTGGIFGPGGSLGQVSSGQQDTNAQAILAPLPGAASSINAISITGDANADISSMLVESNLITIQGTSNSSYGISVTTSTLTDKITIENNSITTSGMGTGLLISAGSDANTAVLAQGNDFNNNAVGVDYMGAGGSTISSDLGGGSMGGAGDNIFSSYTTSSGAMAIEVSGVGSGATLNARDEVFGAANAANVVQGSANVDVSNALKGNNAYVQSLYVELLGTPATPSDMAIDSNQLSKNSLSRAGLVNEFISSVPYVNRVTNYLYVDCLGTTAATADLATWDREIKAGYGLENEIADVVSSLEWQKMNPGNDVETYYNNQLHVSATPTQLSEGYTMLEADGLRSIPLSIVESRAFHEDFALNFMSIMLHDTSTTDNSAAVALADSGVSLGQLQVDLIQQYMYPTD